MAELKIQLCHSVAHNIGRRPVMEDVHHVVLDVNQLCPEFNAEPHAWFAVFDGHAGIESATNAKENLLRDIITCDFYKEGRIEEAIRFGFSKTDTDFMKVCSEQRAQGFYGFRSGCTAICVLVVADRFFVINLGDSRAVLSANGTAVQLSDDHKPSRKEEAERIQQAGGHVLFNRVNGVLGVSRALGDFEFKESNGEQQLISNIPDIREVKIDDSTQFVILACDGLWDVVGNEEAVHLVLDTLTKFPTPQEAVDASAQALLELALKKESTDNISVLLVTLH